MTSRRSSFRRTLLVAAAGLFLGAALFAQGPGGQATPAFVNASDDPMLRGFAFRSIGPATMMGRLDDIEGAEKDPMTMYLGFATGGVWKSTDAGVHWTSMFDEMPVSSIGDIAIAPSDPNVVYVGTGEPNNRQSSTIGGGVYGTRDGGTTWTHLGLDETQTIGRIAVDPTNPNIVFVAAVGHLFGPNEDRGLYKSSDGGKTWKKVKYVDADTGFTEVQIDPVNPKNVYAASYQRRRTWWGVNGGGPGSGVWKSTDGGETFTKLSGGGFPAPPDGIIGRIGLSIFKARPSTIYMIAEVGAEGGIQVGVGDDGKAGNSGDSARTQNGGPNRSGVWRSDDAGKTWTFLTNVNNRPIYYSQIRVDPVNDKKLFQGGASAQWSADGGKTWQPLRGTGHGDYHAIWINPQDPRIVAVGHDGGLDISHDGGLTWDYHNDMALGQFYQVSADMRRPYDVCGGLQDNGSWCGPSAVRAGGGRGGGGSPFGGTAILNTDWYRVGGGDGFYTRQDPTDWTVLYSESQNGSMSRLNLRDGTQKSVRPSTGGGRGGRGGGVGNITNAPANLDELRFYWNTPIEMSPHNPAVLYTGAQYFMKSSNRGDSWWINPTDLSKNVDRFSIPIMGVAGDAPMASKHDGYSNNSVITAINESPSKPGIIWVGTDDGNLHVSLDAGETFTNVIGNIAAAPKGYVQISRIEPSHFDPGTAYVAIDNHRNDDWKPYLFKTTDYGKTWTSVTGNLPAKGNVNAIREDPVNPNLLFVGTEFGLFVSLDGGREWKPFMTGLPRVRIDDLLIHPRDRDLIVATHGRAIWIADDITPLEQLGSAGRGNLVLFEPRPAVQWKSDTEKSRSIPERDFAGNNPQGGTAISFWARSDMGEAKIEILQGANVIRTITTDAQAGMNRVQWNMQPDPAAGGANAGRGGGRGAGGQAAAGGQAGGRGQAAAGGGQGGQAGGRGGGGFGGRGGGGGGVPFVGGGGRGGGFGGGGGGPVDPGSYIVRLTAGGQTLTTSVVVLEDVWMDKK
jgi:Sortilin, neurotensin receptor 3,